MLRTGIAAVLLSAVACGGTEPDPPAAPPSALPKNEYVAQANGICKRVGEEAEAIPEPATPQDYAYTLDRLLSILETGQRQLRLLHPPVADQGKIERNFLDGSDEQAKILRDALPKVRAAAEDGDKSATEEEFVKAFEAFGKIADRDAEWLRSYGLTECA